MNLVRRPWMLAKKIGWLFSGAYSKEKKISSSSSFIKNDILRFEDDNFHLYLSPMYPILVSKGNNTFSINSDWIVLYTKFVPKHT